LHDTTPMPNMTDEKRFPKWELKVKIKDRSRIVYSTQYRGSSEIIVGNGKLLANLLANQITLSAIPTSWSA
ncbi:hypothetical protein ACTXT7_004020, partial [Hymenolepis weldensis]